MVECFLAKEEVAGPNPVSRSTFPITYNIPGGSLYYVQTRRRRRSWKKLLIFLVFLGSLSYGAWNLFSKSEPFSYTGQGSGILGALISKSQPINQEILSAKLALTLKKFEDSNWRIGIYVQDFKTQSSFELNPDERFEAASLTKVPVLVTVFNEIQAGRMAMDQVLRIEANDWQVYGTSVLQYKGPNTTYTVKELLWYLANRSDNTAFQKFVNLLGVKKIAANLYEWGFKVSDITKDVTTPREMVRMFDLTYNAKIIKSGLNQEMLSLMVQTNEEDRIPAGVPAEVRVIHKTGNAIGGLQDSGVVELKNRPYAISILQDNVSDEVEAEKLSAEISKIVYEYLKTLN